MTEDGTWTRKEFDDEDFLETVLTFFDENQDMDCEGEDESHSQ